MRTKALLSRAKALLLCTKALLSRAKALLFCTCPLLICTPIFFFVTPFFSAFSFLVSGKSSTFVVVNIERPLPVERIPEINKKKIESAVKNMSHRSFGKTFLAWGVAVAGLLVLFVFFQFFYRGHLCHREQFSLFLWAAEPLRAYWLAPAPLAKLTGDFLTQFLGLSVAGPLIMAVVLTALGVLWYKLTAGIKFRKVTVFRTKNSARQMGKGEIRQLGLWSLIPAVLLVCVETGRQCGLTYPLSSTLQLVGILTTLLVVRRQKSLVAVLAILAAGVWLFGWGDWEKRAVVTPEMNVERMLAIDNDWYHGRLARMQQRLDKQSARPDRFSSYYQNLLLTTQYRMGDELMHYYQPFQLGLFLPVSATTSYPLVYMSGEMWFQLGDLTNAEHSVLLGMLFSPNSVGSRPLMRLAEISLIRGDEAAAMKYLRVLEKTLFYRRWARMHMPAERPKGLLRWVDMKRMLTVTTDTVRTPMDIDTSLRHLLNNNPDNVFARDYLLSYDLLDKDVDGFVRDYDRYLPGQAVVQRTWAEAMLIWLVAHNRPDEEVAARGISPTVVNDFRAYNELYKSAEQTGFSSNYRRLQETFGKTYWFFYHFAQIRQ